MYRRFGEFESEVSSLWADIMKWRPSWYKTYPRFKKIEIDDAWALFENSKNSLLREQLLGDVSLRSDKPVLRNFGTASGTESTMERGTLKDKGKRPVRVKQVQSSLKRAEGTRYTAQQGTDHIRKGSVLNDGYWWPFKNDAWVLGCVQGLKIFHLAMSTVPDSLLWDDKAGRPRVLGRELIGIHTFGYKRVAHFAADKQTGKPTEMTKGRALIGIVFAPQDKAAAEGATFKQYYDALPKYTSLQSIRDLALSTAVPFDKYDYGKVVGA